MTRDHSADLDLAHELGDLADAETLRRFGGDDLLVETKTDATPVTAADREAEQAIRRHLASTRPGDAVVGEEYGTEGAGRRRWIVDPVDGTKNFVRGVPVWATLIALEEDGELVLGYVSAPALGRRWWATRGGGAFADGRPVRVSAVTDLTSAYLSYASLSGWQETGRLDAFLSLVGRCGRTRAFGDFWSHLMVAEGVVDLSAEPVVNLWDLAALQVIVEEAGGRFTDLSGVARADGGSVVATNGLLHDLVLELLA